MIHLIYTVFMVKKSDFQIKEIIFFFLIKNIWKWKTPIVSANHVQLIWQSRWSTEFSDFSIFCHLILSQSCHNLFSWHQTWVECNRFNRNVIDLPKFQCNSNSNRFDFWKCNSNSNSNRWELSIIFLLLFYYIFALCSWSFLINKISKFQKYSL